jgi:hypothetical protein
MKRSLRSSLLTSILFLLFDYLTAFQITGAGALGGLGPNGERPFRYEINDFAQPGPAFDLFIRALRDFQNADQSEPLSYFQIAGLPNSAFGRAEITNCSRNSWLSTGIMGRGHWHRRLPWILYACFNSISDLA